jgi:manganese-dependent inorganic pyrophosphatase
MESFGTQLLSSGAGLSARDLDELVESDIKIYHAGDWDFSISQVEVTDMQEFSDHLESLEGALDRLRERNAYDFSVLMVTDIVEGSSQLLLRSAPALLDDLPYPRLPDGSLTARGVVSRKKQLLPVMLAMLEG